MNGVESGDLLSFSKTNAMHFRNKGKKCSNFDFKVENQTVDYVSLLISWSTS